jgi:lysophospholipase L1-like esterase
LCSRGPRSYAPLWATAHGARFTFVACGGATTTDVRRSQVGALTDATDLVTITIGGNDAGFVTVVGTCVVGSDGACTAAVEAARGYVVTILPAQLDATYRDIRSRAPRARVIVLGYPKLFELTPSCGWFGLSLAKRTILNRGADTLAGVIAARAAAAGFDYVDVRTVFAGHGICAGIPWINPTTWPVTDSYHPTSAGYQLGYLTALTAVTG